MTNWMEQAQQGTVVEVTDDGQALSRLGDGSTVEASRSRAMCERGIEVEAGDTVLLRPVADSWEIARRYRFEGEREVPLIIPTVDSVVEYLLEAGEDGWHHPYKPVMYDWYDEFSSDLPMWRRLAEWTGGPILELACGTGRVVIDLARAGHAVTGLDYSRAMLDRAEEKLSQEPAEVRERVELVHADMTSWSSDRCYRMAFIACNGLHYMGSASQAEGAELRRRALATLHASVGPGSLAVVSNIAPPAPEPAAELQPAPYLVLNAFGFNPHTSLWTAEYVGRYYDSVAGVHYDGPWRFVEYAEDGRRRAFEFDSPPAQGELRLPDRPTALTCSETAKLLRSVGFQDIQVRCPFDLGPLGDRDRVAVFLARKAACS